MRTRHFLLSTAGCGPVQEEPAEPRKLAESAEEPIADPALRARIFKALDAAASAGTDPSLSQFMVRVATPAGRSF